MSRRNREPLGALFARLKTDVVALCRAELNLYRQTASRRANQAKLPVILIVVAVFIAQSALTTILVGLALGLARWIGPAGGGLVVGLVALGACGLMVRTALARLSAAFSGADDSDSQSLVEEKLAKERAA